MVASTCSILKLDSKSPEHNLNLTDEQESLIISAVQITDCVCKECLTRQDWNFFAVKLPSGVLLLACGTNSVKRRADFGKKIKISYRKETLNTF